MKLQSKFVGIFLPLAVLSSVIIILFIARIIPEVLVSASAEKGWTETAHMVANLEPLLEDADESKLLRFLQESQQRQGAIAAYVLDPSGKVLAHTDVLEHGRLYPDQMRQISQSPSGGIRRIKADGKAALEIYVPLRAKVKKGAEENFLLTGSVNSENLLGSAWLIIPLEQQMQTAETMVLRLSLLVAAVCLLMLVVGIFFIRRALHPIHLLSKGIQSISQGTRRTRLPEGGADELGDLARRFNRMSEILAETTVSKNYFDAIIQNMGDAVVVLNADYSIRSINKAGLDILGYSSRELSGRPFLDLIRKGLGPQAEKVSLLPLLEHAFRELSVSVLAKEGDAIPVLMTISQMKSHQNKTDAIILTLRDMRETHRRMEAEAATKIEAERRAEMEKTALELREALDALKQTQQKLVQSEKLATVGQLAAGVAHELNNPLGGVVGVADILAEELGEDNRWNEDIQVLKTSAQRCKKIVSQLLSFSRKHAFELEKTPASAVLESTWELCNNQLKVSNINVVKKYEQGIPTVQVSMSHMQQVLLNLMLNAADAMPSGGTLTLSAQRGEGKTVRLSVMDTGEGIPQEKLPQIFDAFFTTKDPGKGTGLGLAICREIVEKHGGQIEAHSAGAGKGATFTVTLPAADGD